MKKLILPVMFVALCTSIGAQAQDIIIIEMNDNTTQKFNVEDIDKVIFRSLDVVPNDSTSYFDCPDSNHPHLIDLGLHSGTKWACCNIGAYIPEGYGGYYAWGETEEKDIYDEVTYAYCSGIDEDGDGFYDKEKTFQYIGNDIAGSQFDVAHIKWRGSWTMPTIEQWNELYYECRTKWTTRNGVNGLLVTGRSGGTIFLPASGSRSMFLLTFKDMEGKYWSSTLSPDYESCAMYLLFSSGFCDVNNFDRRYRGCSVRAVCP